VKHTNTDLSDFRTLADLLHSVAARGLASLLPVPAAGTMEVETEKAFHEQWTRERTLIEPGGAVVGPEEIVQWGVARWMQTVGAFLLTPEVEEVVRQIYAVRLLASESDDYFDSLHTIFTALLSRFATSPAWDSVRLEANRLPANIGSLVFDELLARCAFRLSRVRERGQLESGKKDTHFRPNELRSELAAIPLKLDLLATQRELDPGAILAFEQQYRHQVGAYYNRISPPNLSHARSYLIDALYVSPRLTAAKAQGKLDAPAFLTRMFRSVLLGSPGSGKSMLANKLCTDLARIHGQRIVAGRRELIPILVRLRDYGAEKKARIWSLLDFIEAQARSSYQLSVAPPLTFEYLLLTGRALLLFDGLDEVLDTSYRQEISGDIAMFAHLYPSVPMLVTSREVGYEQAPLDEAMFEIYRLLPFDDEQVREFVAKWFSSAGKEDFVAQSDRETETFLKESESTIDLRTNPLLLSLLCSIYGGYHYLPRNRADIYERSAEMFLSTWDKSRSIIPPLLIDQMYLRLLIEYLAYWIYEDGRLQAGVAEEELVAKATEYLYSTLTLYGDRAEAERVARASIEYLRGRAWILAEIGTGEDGRRLYQFIHRGFLEYFAAAHLVRTNSSPIDLLAVLVPHIANREWDAMAELTFQLSSRKVQEADQQLLTGLVDQSRTILDETGFYLLSFAARSLQFLFPGSKVVQTITEECLKRCTEWGRAQLANSTADPRSKSRPRLFANEWPAQLLVNLVAADPKNQQAIAIIFQKRLVASFDHEEEPEALIALEVALALLGANTEERQENSPIIALALDYFEEGRREVIRQLIVDIITASFVDRARTVSLLVDGEKAQIEVRSGSVMILGTEGELVLHVTNGTLHPMGEIAIELTRSAEYDHLTPPLVLIPSLPPQNSTDVCFRLWMKVAGRVSVNYFVNGVMRDPPLSVYASRDNPYIYGSPVDEGEFFGRQEELETIVQAVTKPVKQDMLVVGERRTGKTSLLYQIAKRLDMPFIAIYIVLNTCRPRTDDVLDHILHTIIQGLVERGILESAWRAHEFVSGDFMERVDEVLHEARRMVRDPRLILLLDEADFLLEVEEESASPTLPRVVRRGRHQVDERVQRVLRAALQSHKTGSCLRAVVAGTGDLSAYMLQHSSPFFNHFRFLHLKPLSREETRELIVKPAEMLGVAFSPSATQRISSFSGCQPYYCQALCYEAFAHAQRLNSRFIGDAEVDVAERKIRDDFFHAFLSGTWRRATRRERAVLAALVRGEPCPSTTNGNLQRLLDWQIVARAQEHYRFSAGLFEQWTAMALKKG